MARFATVVGMILVALGLLLGAPSPASLRSALAQPEPALEGGALLYLQQGAIWRLDLATGHSGLFLQVPGGTIRHVAHSPARTRLAYAVTFFDDTLRLKGSRIVVCDADGTNLFTVIEESEPGFWLGWVSWAETASSLVYVKVNPARAIERVERIDLGTGQRSLLLDDGSAPSAAPTSPIVVYQTRTEMRWDVRALNTETGERAQLVKADWFQDADHPAFSPGGGQVAFVAAGAGPLPGERGGVNLLSLLGPTTASAHDLPGVFFDLWSMRPNGSNVRRLAQLFDLQPEFAWSPSGRHIAAMGGFTLQIVDVETGAVRFLDRPLGSGPLSWGKL